MTTCLGKELFIRFTASAFRKLLSISVAIIYLFEYNKYQISTFLLKLLERKSVAFLLSVSIYMKKTPLLKALTHYSLKNIINMSHYQRPSKFSLHSFLHACVRVWCVGSFTEV